jgi:hypothetical protein
LSIPWNRSTTPILLPSTISKPENAPAERARRKLWPRWRPGRSIPRIVAAIVLFVLLAGLWLDTRIQIHGLQQQLISKLADADGL